MSDLAPELDPALPEPTQHREIEEHLAGVHRGANWFYWIAGLSLVNSIIAVSGGTGGFIVGLGVTQVVDAIAGGAAQELEGSAVTIVKVIAFGIALCIAGVVALFGFFANRRHGWAFLLGLILYVLDGVIFLLVRDWLAVGFHLFAGLGILAGYQALRKLRQVEVE